MAYTKIIVIHNRLDRCLNYTQDEEKTSLEAVLDYAMNRDKTEQDCFETALNCDRETAYPWVRGLWQAELPCRNALPAPGTIC